MPEHALGTERTNASEQPEPPHERQYLHFCACFTSLSHTHASAPPGPPPVPFELGVSSEEAARVIVYQ